MPKFAKGSQEAKDFMAKIRNAKKSGEKKPPNHNKGIRKRNKETKVDIPMVNTQTIAIPEFFANKNTDKKGKITYRLVNPLTKTRNLSRRNGETSIKLIRKPITNMILMEHSTEPIPLSLFSKKDRAIIDTHFKVIEEHKEKEVVDIPLSKPFQNKERGRPEKLPKNILVNKQRKGQKQNITMNIEEDEDEDEDEPEPEPEQKPEKKKYKKYATEEERKEAIKQQKRDSAMRIRDAKKGKGLVNDTEKIKGKGKNNISNNNIMPKFVKGSQEAREHMAKIRSLRGAKKNTMSKDMGYESDSSSSDYSVKGRGIETRIPMPSRSGESFLPHQFSKGHSGSDSADALHQSKLGRGLYASGGQGLYASGGALIDDAISQSKHLIGLGNPPPSRSYGSVLGFGVHHHHHYHITGDEIEGGKINFGRIGRAFDPRKNGIAKAFEPVQHFAEKTFTPKLGSDITSGLIHTALPVAVGGLTGAMTTAMTGNPYAGFVAGQVAGKTAGKKAGDELGKATGYGFKKGSKEARDHMAMLRAKKGKGNGIQIKDLPKHLSGRGISGFVV